MPDIEPLNVELHEENEDWIPEFLANEESSPDITHSATTTTTSTTSTRIRKQLPDIDPLLILQQCHLKQQLKSKLHHLLYLQ